MLRPLALLWYSQWVNSHAALPVLAILRDVGDAQSVQCRIRALGLSDMNEPPGKMNTPRWCHSFIIRSESTLRAVSHPHRRDHLARGLAPLNFPLSLSTLALVIRAANSVPVELSARNLLRGARAGLSRSHHT